LYNSNSLEKRNVNEKHRPEIGRKDANCSWTKKTMNEPRCLGSCLVQNDGVTSSHRSGQPWDQDLLEGLSAASIRYLSVLFRMFFNVVDDGGKERTKYSPLRHRKKCSAAT